MAANRERLGSRGLVDLETFEIRKGNAGTDDFRHIERLAHDRKGVAKVVALLELFGNRWFYLHVGRPW